MVSREYWELAHTSSISEDAESVPERGRQTRVMWSGYTHAHSKGEDEGVMRATIAVGERVEISGLDVVEMARSQPDISAQDLLGMLPAKTTTTSMDGARGLQ